MPAPAHCIFNFSALGTTLVKGKEKKLFLLQCYHHNQKTDLSKELPQFANHTFQAKRWKDTRKKEDGKETYIRQQLLLGIRSSLQNALNSRK